MEGGIEAKLSVERDAEEELRREVASTLRRAQGLEVHAQVKAVKFDQRLASMEGAKTVKVDDLEQVCVESREVKRAAWNMQATVYGSDAVKGGDVVLCGLARGSSTA